MNEIVREHLSESAARYVEQWLEQPKYVGVQTGTRGHDRCRVAGTS